jgi:lipopolysaccharide biosynthesis regulator YciM
MPEEPAAEYQPEAAAEEPTGGYYDSGERAPSEAALATEPARPGTSEWSAAARPPSGSRAPVILVGLLVLAGAVAAVTIFVIRPRLKPGLSAPEGGAETAALEQEKADLRAQLDGLRQEKEKLQAKALEERKALEADRDAQRKKAEALLDGLKRRSDAARLTLEAAVLVERRADLAAAARIASAAISRDPEFSEAHLVKGRALAASNRGEEALAAFKEADATARKAGLPGNAEALVEAGELCLTDVNDGKRAAEFFKLAAALKSDPGLSLVAEARLLFMDGKLDEAARKASEAKKAAPTLYLAPLVLGEIAHAKALASRRASERARLLEEAGDLLGEALSQDPNSARACLLQGKIMFDKGAGDGAAGGFGMARLQALANADRFLTRALELSPHWPEPHLALARLKLGRGAMRDAALALTRADRAVRLTDRKDAPALATLAEAQAATGNPAAAALTMGEAIQLEPTNNDYQLARRRYQKEARALGP